MILSVSNISKTYDKKEVLRDVSFHIEEHEKCAVTGINGAGKSTLLKIIAGAEDPDSGTVSISRDKKLSYLEQNPSENSEKTIYEEVLSTKSELINKEKRLRELEERIAELSASDRDEDLSPVLSEYERLSFEFKEEGGYAIESNITGVLKGLGFDESDFSKQVSTLSGGQKTRLALSRLLLSKPDILLLDEPTNHLDISSVSWLEGFLKNYKGAVIIVSHDRYFLDRIVGKVIDIENARSRTYIGNYTDFSEKKAALRKDMIKAYLNNQAEIKHQQEVIEKLRSFNREKSIKRAESREKMLNKIERVEKPLDIDDAMKLRFTPSVVSGNDVLSAQGLSKAYDGTVLFQSVSLDIKRGEKVAIIGQNGTGKTTLLKIIDGILEPDTGTVKFGSKVEKGYYDQEHHVLDPENTVFMEISDEYPHMTNTEIRSLLAAFLFTGDDVFKQVKDLSGGEKGRLSLAKLMLSRSNLLLLDEPTNHLDITSKEILEEAIRNYEGTVIYVSHDRYFINRTATRILELSDRRFVNYLGNYDYYLEKKSDPFFDSDKAVSGEETRPAKKTDEAVMAVKEYINREENRSKLDWQQQKERKAKLGKLKNELKACEKEIASLEQRDFEIDDIMSHPEVATNSAKLNELTVEKDKLKERLEELYQSWEDISVRLDEAENEEF